MLRFFAQCARCTVYDMNHAHFLFFFSPLTFSIFTYFEQKKAKETIYANQKRYKIKI